MSDYRRVYIRGGCYFFTLVTHQRLPYFSDKSSVDLLMQAMNSVMVKQPFSVDAMVVLPDHLHCIWRMPSHEWDYSSRWREIKKIVTKRIRLRDGRREANIWQARFWEHLIRDEEDWRCHMDYIHYNPVKHRLVSRVGDWPFSSFHRLVSEGWYPENWGEQCPIHLHGMECE